MSLNIALTPEDEDTLESLVGMDSPETKNAQVVSHDSNSTVQTQEHVKTQGGENGTFLGTVNADEHSADKGK
ncbi:unnamed protein product [Discula destructiva]